MYSYQTQVRPTASATAQPGQGASVGASSGGPSFQAAMTGSGSSPVGGGIVPAVMNKLGGGGDPLMAQTQQMLQESQQFNLQFLGIQEQMQQENRSFSTLSNVLKARHETMRSSISNIK